jgi:D-aminoacyl-tRNA deacylase
VKAVVQRVLSASVSVDGKVVGAIEQGFLVLAGAHRDDTEQDAAKLADRIFGMRIFNDENGKMNLSLKDVGGAILAVSNFTLYGDAMKQRRPSFIAAAPFDRGKELFDCFTASLRGLGCHVEEGVFGADMRVTVLNDGPVTLVVEAAPNAERV